jgi:hypothetical protein
LHGGAAIAGEQGVDSDLLTGAGAAMLGGSVGGRYYVNGPLRSGLAGLLARGGVGVSGGLLME